MLPRRQTRPTLFVLILKKFTRISTVAEVLKDEFTHKQSQRDAVDTTVQLEHEAEATIELSARFLAYVSESIAEDQSTHARTALLLNVFKYFTSTYLATKDIQSFFDIHFQH